MQSKVLSGIEAFSEEFWMELGEFNIPILFKGAMTDPHKYLSESDCLQLMEALSKTTVDELADYDSALRAYRDGRMGYQEKIRILSGSPHAGETLESYCIRQLGEHEYTLIVNNTTHYLPRLHHKILSLGLYDRVAKLPRLEGSHLQVNSTIFMGNYTQTPLGIHRDDDFLIGGLHLHNGPGQKDFYLWPAELYQRISGTKRRVFDNLSKYKNNPEVLRFNIEAGDAFFFPQLKDQLGPYHVASTSGFCFSLVLGLIRQTPAEVLAQLAHESLSQVSSTNLRDALKELRSNLTDENINKLLDSNQLNQGTRPPKTHY